MVRWSLCVGATAMSLSAASAQTMLGAADILDAIPSSVPVGEARAVALVPAGRGPTLQGVLLLTGESGWGAPAIVVLRDGAPGARESPDYVLIFRTRRSVERVTSGDGRVQSDVVTYAGHGSTFAPVSLAGATLRRAGPFAGAFDHGQSEELIAKLSALTAPGGGAISRVPLTIDWSRVLEQREVFLGGFAALGAWLAMLKGRKRSRWRGRTHRRSP